MQSLPRRQPALLFALLLLTIWIYKADMAAEKRGFSIPVNRVVVAGIGSCQWGTTLSGSFIAGLVRPIVRARSLDRENQRLKQEISRLKTQVIELHEMEAENTRLTSLLGIRSSSSYNTVAATVISRGPSNWYDTITLDRGKLQGIRPGSVVMTEAGVVGRAFEVSDFTCSVLLITDPRAGVAALVQRTRQPGVVEGRYRPLVRLSYMPKDADIKKDDVVLTSGLGKVFPAGIPIGKVVSVGRDAYSGSKVADIQPYADPARVEHVLVASMGER